MLHSFRIQGRREFVNACNHELRPMNIPSNRESPIVLKRLAALGIPLALLTIFAVPAARADHIDTAHVTQLTCDSFTITLSASALTPGQSYEIDFSVSVTDTACMPPGTVTYSVPFTAPPSGTFTTTLTKTFPPARCPLTFSGSATLVGENMISIIWPNGQTSDRIICPAPTPTPRLYAGHANHIDTAHVTQLTCDSFTITLSASALTPGQSYEIDFSVSVTDIACMPPGTVTYSVPFTAPPTGTFTTTLTKTFPPVSCPLTFSGRATLVGENMISIIWPNGQTSDRIICPAPTPNRNK
jgi:hypothetical protein